ncbi:MAG: helix-turn-helix transcriptional regulator [Firmicutes bacterium]|nr:helix-turn-helix transcriptional regulator [Bacillota bacterium]
MTAIKINEQIAFFRKRKCLTQEELANALGVTNQAVSKWESAQCCPDLQLLPDIAAFFGVSLDDLFGYSKENTKPSDLPCSSKNVSLFEEAVELAKNNGCIYASLLQRKLNIGYKESLKLISEMESFGYIQKDRESHKYCFCKQE